MAIKFGFDAKLYRNTASFDTPTWVEITNVKDATVALEKGEADVTTRANNGWRALAGTLKDGSIEFEMVWDTEDENFTAIKDAYFNNTTLDVAAMDGDMATPGSQGLRAVMEVINFSRSEPLEEALTVSVSIKPGYTGDPAQAPDWMEVS